MQIKIEDGLTAGTLDIEIMDGDESISLTIGNAKSLADALCVILDAIGITEIDGAYVVEATEK